MKKGRQKQKGTAYERMIAKLFTEAYYSAEDGEFRRVPLSGGWDKRTAPGDLIALKYVDKEGEAMVIDSSFPFSVECKTWRDENVKHFFSGLYSNETVIFEAGPKSPNKVTILSKILSHLTPPQEPSLAPSPQLKNLGNPAESTSPVSLCKTKERYGNSSKSQSV